MRRSRRVAAIGGVAGTAVCILGLSIDLSRQAAAVGGEASPAAPGAVSPTAIGSEHALRAVEASGMLARGELLPAKHIECDESALLAQLEADLADPGMHVVPSVETTAVGDHGMLATTVAIGRDQATRHGPLMHNREIGFIVSGGGTEPLMVRDTRLAREDDAYTLRMKTTLTNAIDRVAGGPTGAGGFAIEHVLRFETVNADLFRAVARDVSGSPGTLALEALIVDLEAWISIDDGRGRSITLQPGTNPWEALSALGLCSWYQCMLDCLVCLEGPYILCAAIAYVACLPISCTTPATCFAGIVCSVAGCVACYFFQEECDESVLTACAFAVFWCIVYDCPNLVEVPDCENTCRSAAFLGDGTCDAFFDCPEYGCDAGDCQPPCGPVDFLRIAPFTSTAQLPLDMGDCKLGPSAEHEYEVLITASGLWTFRVCGGPIVMHLTSHRCAGLIAETSQLKFEGCATASAEFQVVLSPGTYYVTLEEAFGAPTYTLDVLRE